MVEQKEISDLVEKESVKYGWKNKIKEWILNHPISTPLFLAGLVATGYYGYLKYLASEEKRKDITSLLIAGAFFIIYGSINKIREIYFKEDKEQEHKFYRKIIRDLGFADFLSLRQEFCVV